MVNQETNVMTKIRMKHSEETGGVLFRNNVGLFYTKNGTATVCGLGKGSSDLIGWTPVKITQGMVGQELAVFTAVEVKTGKGRATKEQKKFIEIVNKNGGIGRIEHG